MLFRSAEVAIDVGVAGRQGSTSGGVGRDGVGREESGHLVGDGQPSSE